MEGRIKVATIIGTRPEIIRLSRVIAELDITTDHVLVHTGQNYDYELTEIFFEELGIREPDYHLQSAGKNVAITIGQIIMNTDEVLEKENPDAVLIYGDTNSTLSIISAKRRKIPVFHMEAGNRCFDQRVPEELNRKIVDHLSDINMPISGHARNYLISEGIRPETIIKTGSPMKEVLEFYAEYIDNSDILKKLELNKGSYLLISFHREENIDSDLNLSLLIQTLQLLNKNYNYKILVSTHPRTKKRLISNGYDRLDPQIKFLKPFGYFDYIKLQQNAFCVISDSGTITEESSIIGFPAVNIRNTHERMEGMDETSVIMSGLKPLRVLQAVELAVRHSRIKKYPSIKVDDYDTACVSKKVVRIILSYTDYINQTIWRKDIL